MAEVNTEVPPRAKPLRSRANDIAYRKIRDAIAEGQFGHESRLVEVDLCNKLQVGRTPLREAMWRLEGEGLIQNIPNAGFYITRLTLEEIEELYEIRLNLEVLAIRLACRRGFSGVKLRELETICAALDAAVAADDARGAASADLEFHRGIVRLANSKLLEKAISNSCIQIFSLRRSVNLQVCGEDAVRLNVEHRTIIQHLEHRSGSAAEQALAEHIAGGRDRLIEAAARHSSPFNVVGELVPPTGGESSKRGAI